MLNYFFSLRFAVLENTTKFDSHHGYYFNSSINISTFISVIYLTMFIHMHIRCRIEPDGDITSNVYFVKISKRVAAISSVCPYVILVGGLSSLPGMFLALPLHSSAPNRNTNLSAILAMFFASS